MHILEPIRVLNLFTIMDRGGSETMVMNYYRNINRSIIQYDFLVHRGEKGMYDEEILSLGGRIFRTMPLRPWTLPEYKQRIRYFFSEHPEYHIVHSHMSERGAYVLQEAKRVGVPVRICHAHGTPRGFDIRTIPAWYLKKKAVSCSTDLFMCGEAAGRWLFGDKKLCDCIQMNNAIDSANYKYSSINRTRIRGEFKIAPDAFVVGHVGRFDAVKNHAFLVRIFHEIEKRHPKSVLLMVGDDTGKEAQSIRNLINSLELREKTVFAKSRNDVAAIMSAMDVFVFPSIFEGFGMAALEAQAAGLPTFVSEWIPTECYITDLIEAISLTESPTVWANKILNARHADRTDTTREIVDAGFDIKANASWLQDFYLKAYER